MLCLTGTLPCVDFMDVIMEDGSTTYAHPTNAHPTNAHRTNAHPTNAHMLIWKTTFAHNDYIYGERHLLATYFLLT